MQPTVVRLSDRSDLLAREEVFGPVLAVMEVDDEEDALALANATQYGLAAAVFTQSLARATRFADGLEAGLIKVNSSTAGVDYHAPFGGVGSSSFGPREQGLAAVEFFTELKTISITP
jgi:aldehyde dehydrogenase (NAD+)